MSYILGFDASTQSLSATLVDAQSLKVSEELSVNFGKDLPQYNSPAGYILDGAGGQVHSNPLMWLDALDLLFERITDQGWKLSEVIALSGSGQQHGSVYLNDKFESAVESLSSNESLSEQLECCLARSSSPIWMDNTTATECAEITATVGGSELVCEKSGSVMTARFTGPQIRKFSKLDPKSYEETTTIHLVSSWFASLFAGKNAAIDAGDAAGMNLLNLDSGEWDQQLVQATADNLLGKLPSVAKPLSVIGAVSSYFVEKYGLNEECQVAVWSGDNPCSLVGMGASQPGNMVISLGTSYTLFAAMDKPVTDPNGFGHVFGNPIGGFMSLICFKNGSLAREQIKKTKSVDWSNFGNDYLDQTSAGNEGKVMLPFYETEITPLHNEPVVATNNWSLEDEDAAVQIRACIEGQVLNMKLHSEWLGSSPKKVLLTGGGSNSQQICQIVADVFQADVARLTSTASASLGAAMMAGVATKTCNLEDLERSLCQTSEVISPNRQAAPVYASAQEKFTKLLNSFN